MAGHSKFKNIMHRKGAQDAKRAKRFTKIIKEITVAARAGNPDPSMNPRLRTALAEARVENVSKDTIERAIKKATEANTGENFEEIRYEGYGAKGVAVIVEALTDNRNRTASDVRSTFSKYGGSLGETNSVSFMFNRVGQIIYPLSVGSADRVFEAAIEAGAENVESGDDAHEITCAVEDFYAVRDALEKALGAPQEAGLTWIPQTTVALDEEAAISVLKLIDVLEDNDDVRSVSANFDIAPEILVKLAG
jgi:YebC/PmpR family DNA-binding regulatory protein